MCVCFFCVCMFGVCGYVRFVCVCFVPCVWVHVFVCERDSTGNHVVPQDSPLPAPVLVLPLYGRCCVVRGRFATACLQHASVLLLALQPSLSLSPSLSLPPSLL